MKIWIFQKQLKHQRKPSKTSLKCFERSVQKISMITLWIALQNWNSPTYIYETIVHRYSINISWMRLSKSNLVSTDILFFAWTMTKFLNYFSKIVLNMYVVIFEAENIPVDTRQRIERSTASNWQRIELFQNAPFWTCCYTSFVSVVSQLVCLKSIRWKKWLKSSIRLRQYAEKWAKLGKNTPSHV